jgi:N-acetylglucosamine-6-phosphate deacetylase
MIALTGGDLVLPDRVWPSASLIVDPHLGVIAALEPRAVDAGPGRSVIDCRGHAIAPGFIDVHVHGVDGVDVLDGLGSVGAVASRLTRHGVTAFCPTSVACAPSTLEAFLGEVAALRAAPPPAAARVLPAHLESNFINPEWNGAQPRSCLRTPGARAAQGQSFSTDDILAILAGRPREIAIVTLAPELPGGIELVRTLRDAGHIVSIGHTGATYEVARAAIDAGVRHATHLFNRMSPLAHRAPGATGAALESSDVVAELICDGMHVHPAVVSMALRAKGLDRIVAITDATAVAGLPVGARARLGGRTILAGPRTAELEDGTIAGSLQTMDGVFRLLVHDVRLTLPEAARICAKTPAEHLGLSQGRLAVGAPADVIVLDAGLRVRQTFVAGRAALEPV